jgi:hypothetical protein
MEQEGEEFASRLELEIAKFMDINTIFKRLKSSASLQEIYDLY